MLKQKGHRGYYVANRIDPTMLQHEIRVPQALLQVRRSGSNRLETCLSMQRRMTHRQCSCKDFSLEDTILNVEKSGTLIFQT